MSDIYILSTHDGDSSIGAYKSRSVMLLQASMREPNGPVRVNEEESTIDLLIGGGWECIFTYREKRLGKLQDD